MLFRRNTSVTEMSKLGPKLVNVERINYVMGMQIPLNELQYCAESYLRE